MQDPRISRVASGGGGGGGGGDFAHLLNVAPP